MFLYKNTRLTKQLRPSKSDEQLYLAARHIVGAQMQAITYNEFLPLVLGRDLMRSKQLSLFDGADQTGQYDRDGHLTQYDRQQSAAISNAFATAAFRFGHTLIDDVFLRQQAE